MILHIKENSLIYSFLVLNIFIFVVLTSTLFIISNGTSLISDDINIQEGDIYIQSIDNFEITNENEKIINGGKDYVNLKIECESGFCEKRFYDEAIAANILFNTNLETKLLISDEYTTGLELLCANTSDGQYISDEENFITYDHCLSILAD